MDHSILLAQYKNDPEMYEKMKQALKLQQLYQAKEDGFFAWGSDGKLVPDYQALAAYLVAENEIVYYAPYGQFLRYEDGVYEHLYDELFRQHINAVTKKQCRSSSQLNNFFAIARAEIAKNPKIFKSPEKKINLQNGVLDLWTGELEPHSQKYFFTYKMPITFDPKAKVDESSVFLAWLKGIMNNDEGLVSLIQQMFGYVLLPGPPFLHKAFVLYGSGSNGKSTLLEILRNIIGENLCARVSIENLSTPFSVRALVGKKVNILNEVSNKQMEAETFKDAVAGGVLTAAYKGKDEFDFKCEAKFVISCNELPKFGDNSHGLKRRLLFIPFDRQISAQEAAEFNFAEILAELPAILNWALEGARIVSNARYIEQPKASHEVFEEYKHVSDSVYAFFVERLELGPGYEKFTSDALHNIYREYCEKQFRIPVGKSVFGRRFKEIVREKVISMGLRVEDYIIDKDGHTRAAAYRNLRYI